MTGIKIFKSFFINLGIALKNTNEDILRNLKDKRLWIALLISIFLHTVIFLMGIWNSIVGNKQNILYYELTEVTTYDPSHRRVTKKVVQKERIKE